MSLLDLMQISLQPNSGAQGEYAGLMVIKAYHESNGDTQRDIILIPSSAHGTNPASAVMAGMKVVVTGCDENGNIDIPELKSESGRIERYVGGIDGNVSIYTRCLRRRN